MVRDLEVQQRESGCLILRVPRFQPKISCGSVYGGYRRADNLPVAIKHIPKGNVVWTDTDENGQRLTIEVAAMLKLQTESADSVGKSAPISLLDWYDFNQEQILVLERPVPAVDLSQFVKNNKEPLQENQAKTIIKQLVDAVKHLEDTNIFHRDIKPQNILDMNIKIGDFGLATQLKLPNEKHFTMCGTPNYISPEVATRSAHGLESDVWSLGCMFYAFLMGRPPFDTDTVKHTLSKVVLGDYEMPCHVSLEAQDLIHQLLQKDPTLRPSLSAVRDPQMAALTAAEDL
uniref:Serine/threonine-protein kinase n=1 Tax=Nothobranchius furzeri TaxID=105023 RepID=A0A8C6PBP7_NOTFU